MQWLVSETDRQPAPRVRRLAEPEPSVNVHEHHVEAASVMIHRAVSLDSLGPPAADYGIDALYLRVVPEMPDHHTRQRLITARVLPSKKEGNRRCDERVSRR